MRTIVVRWGVARAGRGTTEDLLALQRRRFRAIAAFARRNSDVYARHYAGCGDDATAWPAVTKSRLMADLEAWVTDPRIRDADVRAFLADPARAGQPFLGRYTVVTTSGTTGEPARLLHDGHAASVYDALWNWRAFLPRVGVGELLRPDFSEALLIATGAHFAGVAHFERIRRRVPWMASRLRIVPVGWPLASIVAALNELRPRALSGYPTALELLAEEQRAGRLRVRPRLVVASGEALSPAARAAIGDAFGVPVLDVYGSSEFLYLAFGCEHGWLHVNADWAILEPVDAAYRPVPPGVPSDTVLLTNLVNRVQPIVRYDLGDGVLVRPDPCPCGSPFPALRVVGRQDDVLDVVGDGGERVRLLPLALTTPVETTRGVRRYQVVQRDLRTLEVALEIETGAEAPRVWQEALSGLRAYLTAQGAGGVRVVASGVAPAAEARSGKWRHVVSMPRAPYAPADDAAGGVGTSRATPP
ncbi:MAG: hypothetical protein P1P87_08375 [Trueperaceae bacterium]|nr:hypothetical protein [Trueperaceae bacterium]